MTRAIVFERVQGAVTVQDGGRRGRMHEGVPPGGALVPELLSRANLFAGNAWDAPALEVHGRVTFTATHAATRVATEHGALSIEDRSRWVVERARYVAVRGGFDVPTLLGGRGALLSAGIGARIASGDTLRVADDGGDDAHERRDDGHDHRARDGDDAHARDDGGDRAFRVVSGPDVERFQPSAFATLLGSPFAMTAAVDRVGARLRGPALARRDGDAARSMPMTRGAIEVPHAGDPIVLGPDHPTTGGYPVIATIIRADIGRFFERATSGAGSSVRFVEISAELARVAWHEHRVRHGMLG